MLKGVMKWFVLKTCKTMCAFNTQLSWFRGGSRFFHEGAGRGWGEAFIIGQIGGKQGIDLGRYGENNT